MKDISVQLMLCPACGSKNHLENYPVQGSSTCVDCGHEVTSVALNVIQEDLEDIPSICTSCGKDNEVEEPIFDEGTKVVYKCTACGKLDGYLLLPPTFQENEVLNDIEFDGLSVIIAKTEGKLVYPGYSNEKEQNALGCFTEFETLINEKKETMKKLGVDFQTINLAIEKANNYLAHKGPFSDKQLKHIFPAALILAQSNFLGLGKLQGTKLTERKLEEIFRTNRKTTRKWKDALEKDVG